MTTTMIKSHASPSPCQKKELPFPKLMIHYNNGRIILFTSQSEGVVVNRGTILSSFHVGEYSKGWTSVLYRDYKGSVCLENGDHKAADKD